MKDQVFKLTEMALKNEIIKKRAQVADNILSKLLEEIKMEQVLPRFESKAFIDAIEKNNEYLYQNAGDINSNLFRYKRFDQQKAREFCLNCIPTDIDKKYQAEALNWVITKFVERKIVFLNDLSINSLMIERSLETFYQIKQLNLNRFLEESDIYKINDGHQVLYIAEKAAKLFKKYNEEKSYNQDWQKGANLIYEDDNWKIYIPENKAAACHLGKGTEWCTAAPGLDYYEDYHQPDDPLIIFISKKDPSEKYQCNLIGGSFMDKDDITASNKIQIKLKTLLRKTEYIRQRPNLFEEVKDFDYADLPNGGCYEKQSDYYRFLDSKGKDFTEYVKIIANLEKNDIIDYTKYTEFESEGRSFTSGEKTQVKTETGIYHFDWLRQVHRDNDLPAIENFDGSKKWYRKGQLHRSNGPAVINSDGTEKYYFLGSELSKEEYEQIIGYLTKKMGSIDENKQPTSLSESIFNKTRQLLEESKLSDLLAKYREFAEQIDILNKNGTPYPLIEWAAKYMASKPPEGLDEIVNVVIAFNKNKQKIAAKHGNNATDIFKYKALADIQNIVLSLDQQQKREFYQAEQSEYDVIFENEDWKVIFPKTKKASIYFGDGTSWCTAYKTTTGGLQNQYIYYSSANIFLSYFINKKTDKAEINIGFQEGEPVFDGNHGGVSVLANNNGITRESFDKFANNVLKEPYILNIIKKWYKNHYKNQHPIVARKDDQDFIFDILKSDHILLNEMLVAGTYAQNVYSLMFRQLYKTHVQSRTKIDQKIVDYFYNKKNGVFFILLFEEHFDNKCLNNLQKLYFFNSNIENFLNAKIEVNEVNGDNFTIGQTINGIYVSYKISWPDGQIVPDENGYVDVVTRLFDAPLQACKIPFKNNDIDYSKPIIGKDCSLYADESFGFTNNKASHIVFDHQKQIVINDKEYFFYKKDGIYVCFKSKDGNSFIRTRYNLRVGEYLNFYDFNDDATRVVLSNSRRPDQFRIKNILETKDYYYYIDDHIFIFDKNEIANKEQLKNMIIDIHLGIMPDQKNSNVKIIEHLFDNDREQYEHYHSLLGPEIDSQYVLHTKAKKEKTIEESSKAIFKRTQQLLQEEVFGAQAFVYHGSSHGPDEFIPMMLNNEFDPGNGSGAMYGKGLYCVHKLEDSATNYGNYGPNIYKFKVNLHGYIIFDDDITKKVYGKYLSIVEQAKLCGYSSHVIKFLEEGFHVEADGEVSYSSDLARPASKGLSGLVKGLVFTGRNDGRVVVIYDASTAIPIAHKNLWGGGWIKIDKQSLKDKLSRSVSGDFDKEKYGKNTHMFNRMLKHNLSGAFNKIYEDKTTGLSLFSIVTDKQAEFVKTGFPSISKRSNEQIKETILIAKDNEYGILAYDYYNRLVYRYESKLNTMSFNSTLDPFFITNEIIKSLSNVIPGFINTISQKYYYEKLPDDGYIKKNESYHAYFDKHHSYHRDDGPAITYNESEGGGQLWYQHGKRHRDDGPAIISPNGTEEWYKDGKLHRDNNLPAVVTKDGLKIWYRDGKLHRSNGPAVINKDGTEEYYILGQECSKEKYDEGMAALRKTPIKLDENKQPTIQQLNKSKFNNKSMNLFQLISEEIYK